MKKIIKYGILYLFALLLVFGATVNSHCKRSVYSSFITLQPELLRDSKERAIEIIHHISTSYQKATLDNNDKLQKGLLSVINKQENHILPEIAKVEYKLPDFQLLHPISYYIYSLHKIRT